MYTTFIEYLEDHLGYLDVLGEGSSDLRENKEKQYSAYVIDEFGDEIDVYLDVKIVGKGISVYNDGNLVGQLHVDDIEELYGI